jgi:hypothetical protein
MSTTRTTRTLRDGAVHGAHGADDLVDRPSGETIAAFAVALEKLTVAARGLGVAYKPAGR